MTVLHIAAANGQVEVIDKAIEMGLSPDIRGAFDLTPLHVAAINAEAEAVRQLLSAGADASLMSNAGLTPYEIADMDIPEVWANGRPDESLEIIKQLVGDTPSIEQ